MEVLRIIILVSSGLLLFEYFFIKKEKVFYLTSFINYLVVIMAMLFQLYSDYQAAFEMYVLMEAGTMKQVPNIIAYINTNNLFFIGYSLIYIIFLIMRKTSSKN